MGNRRLQIESLEDRRLLAALTVNSRLDNVNAGDGVVTLREAIFAANNDTTTDLGESGSGADTILFDAQVFGPPLSIAVTQGEIPITETLTIDATARQELTIKAFQQSRLFYITAAAGNVTLAGLTLEDGRTTGDGSANYGGAIRSLSAGTVTIDQCVIRDNATTGSSASGGAIFSQGPLIITGSTIEANTTSGQSSFGGAILSLDTVTLTTSTVSGNSTVGVGSGGGAVYAAGGLSVIESTISGNRTEGTAARGGALFSGGAATFTRSTISGNSTLGNQSKSGGIHSADELTLIDSTVSGNSVAGDFSSAGGIYSAGDMMIFGSTLSGNTTSGQGSDGGAIQTSANLTIQFSTITANSASYADATGGGIQCFGANVITITNSIVAGNSAGGGLNDIDPGSGTLNIDFGLVQDITGLTINGGGNVTGLDPLLGPLTDNGGPTETHAVLTGSPALDAGDPSVLPGASAFDQRQSPFIRVFDGDSANGARVDMGSYENQTFRFTVDTTADEFDGDYSAGDLSLREVVAFANGTAGIDTITFDTTVFATPQTILLSLGEIEVTDAVTIEGPGQQILTIDAQQQSRIFDVSGTGLTTLSRMTLTNGEEVGTEFLDGGGAVRSRNASLIINESTISDSSSSSSGGGIFGYRNITLTDSTVSGNSALYSGGGVFSADGRVTLNGSTVSGNVATNGDGGGIYSYYNAALNDSFVTDNTADSYGGGVVSYYGDVELTGSTASGNVSGIVGGGVFAYYDVTLSNSTVSGNSADFSGGGIFANYCVDAIDSTVSGNTADAGGGIYSQYGSVGVTGSTISGNSAISGAGGGIFTAYDFDTRLRGGNERRSGGRLNFARRLNCNGSVTVVESTISGNHSTAMGGGGILSSGFVTVMHSTVTSNQTDGPSATGGGIWVNDDLMSITNSIVAGNLAGGGLNDINPGSITAEVNFSLIGNTTGLVFNGSNNITNVDPLLGPLADNGGTTQTHALMPGSPAIDSGDPGIALNPIEFDQRGDPFLRVVDGDADTIARIDIGAYERQSEIMQACDFDGDDDCDIDDIDALMMEIAAGTDNLQFDVTGDGMVDLADRDEWLSEAGMLNLPMGNPYLAGDSNLDGTVDGQDFLIWNSNKFTPTGKWSQADWNGDGMTDGQDFLVWNGNKFQSGSSALVGVPLEISLTPATLVDSVLIDSWLDQREYLDMEVTGVSGVFRHPEIIVLGHRDHWFKRCLLS